MSAATPPKDDMAGASTALTAPRARSVRPPGAPAYRDRGVSKYRFFRAYYTTFQVIFSYFYFSFKARWIGKGYREKHIGGVHQRNARRVYQSILVLQGLFIKVGQLLSILANFLPEEFRHELEGLQDQVPPRPYHEIKSRIENDLGKQLPELFESLSEEPLASASLGQVHEAHLKDGTRVAVKVQHKDIDEIVKLDLKTIRRIMQIVEWFVPVQGLDAYYHQIKELLEQELDFNLEANNIETISKNFEKDPAVHFPIPIRSHSTKRVLTTTFVTGWKLSDTAALDAAGIDKRAVAKKLVQIFCQMIFVDGVYHADPHPGNILVDAEGNLILLDFGAVAELSSTMREGIPEFLEGVIRRDTDKLIRALRTMGFLSKTSDLAVSEKVVEYFHSRFQEEVKIESLNLKDIKIDPQKGLENLLDLRKMNVGLKELSAVFHVPRDWVVLERTILLVYGCCSLLDQELNPMSIIRPYLQEFVLGNRDYSQIALEAVKDMALSAVTLPEDLKKFLHRAVRGEMEVKVRGVEESTRTLYTIGRQVIYVAITIAAGFFAMSLHDKHMSRGTNAMLAVGGLSALMFVISSLRGRPKS